MIRSLVLTLVLLLSIPIESHASSELRLIPITLEHAQNPTSRARGLQGRRSLDPDHGMLFHFPEKRIARFWMYRTLIDLSVAFLDDDGKILQIEHMRAFPEVSDPSFFSALAVESKVPVRYALEMAGGWFADKGVHIGDQLRWAEGGRAAYIIKHALSKH